MQSYKKLILVFSGYNQRAIIAFLRTLEYKKIDYAIIAKDKHDEIFLTDYSDHVFAIRKSIPLILDDLLMSINKVRQKYKEHEFIIAPTTEALNRFLLENKEEFEQAGCTIPLVNKELYEKISDKYSFGNICRDYLIDTPYEIDIEQNISFPIVAKPKQYFSSIKNKVFSPIILNDANDFDLFKSKYPIDDFYYQEFIRGKSIYLLYYFHRDGTIYKFSQENLMQQPKGKSMLAAVSSNFHNSLESEKFERLFKDLNYFGLVMVEMKQYEEKNYMIEANPRFWGPSQFFVDAGINFFETFLHDFGILETINLPKKPINSSVKYFWFGGLSEALTNYHELVYHAYTENELLQTLHEWMKYDIYRRIDTKSIFVKELYGDRGN
ncbi:hypothetical protein [Bacillus sp. FJAT-49736]|uniref:hypothetical protein n=1 Tax=Bacillus sp. FJAT-49736 TaxID=2833582 RepID=UPI001BC9E9F3|nr:hypothetical protein [Bacillus sp. FJAT-49736]MBS4174154.1 hypothetical protein [Bacillus sp. FJAT-49736]